MALDTKAFNTAFRRFLLSSILIALSGCLGNIVDSVIVGHLIGEDGVSAINLAKPVVQLMFSMSLLLASGAGMLIGIELGKQEHDRAGFTFCLSIIGCIAFGLIMTICGVFFTAPIAHWLCANEQLYAGTHAYLRPMMLGAPMYMLAWGMATLVGVDGSPRLCSVAILVDNAVNLCLDIVFIQWLNLGIEGSSIATVIGHVVGIGIMCRHFFYKDNHLKWRMSGEWWPQTGAILSQGLPLALASICLTALLYSANSIVLRSLGTVGIFAFAGCMNLLQIYNMFLSGASRTLQSLGAIQVGKGDNEMFLLVIRKSFRFITIAMLVTCVTIWLFPEYVTRFFGADEQHLIDAGAHALRIFAFSFIPYCYLYVLMVVYKLYGYHAISLFISLALSLMVIPVLWLMARYDPNYLWYGYLIAYMIVALIVFIWHKAGKITFALRVLGVLLCLVMVAPTEAKIRTEFGDSTKTHVFTLSADLMTRGEYIQGAVPNHNETMAAFVVERTRLILNYKQRYLEVQVIPEHLGVWGTTGGGAFNLREAWAQTEVKGFLAKLGRQTLSYDDERIIGSDDWSMTSPYHDALKIGYEGFGHKIHLIGAYCQNNANTLGGTSYYDGAQPYKNMEVLWYHYDFKRWFSGSLLFINTGLQSHVELPGGKLEKKTHYQQLAGTYWRFRYDGQKDWWIDADASFYYQFGKTLHVRPVAQTKYIIDIQFSIG